jgi:hypothetical protein
MNETNRPLYVCDSFCGLPPGDLKLYRGDLGWDHTPYLEVSVDTVVANFHEFGVLDENVIFAKGIFNVTMPRLAKQVARLAVLRLDGDMYESTVDVLYHMYEKVSLHGFVIVDDWYGYPAKAACEDFFIVHKISPQIVPMGMSAYWKKTVLDPTPQSLTCVVS